MTRCGEQFLVSVDVEIEVDDCSDLDKSELKAIKNIGRSMAKNEARRQCPDDCKNVKRTRDHHIILGPCKDGVLEATYEGWYECTQ